LHHLPITGDCHHRIIRPFKGVDDAMTAFAARVSNADLVRAAMPSLKTA